MSEIQEVRFPVDDLEIGMYVSRLDRPWIETPFPMAGFLISSEAEIEQLQKYCRHVYVDIEVGLFPDPEREVPDYNRLPLITVEEQFPDRAPRTAGESRAEKQKRQYAELRRCTYQEQTPLHEELQTAGLVHDSLHQETMRILSDLQAGHKLDFEVLREHIHDTVESIIRNPSALMLLVQLERSDRYTYNHALGSSVWCAEFGRHLGLDRGDINDLALGGILLDIGKTRLPPELFDKPELDAADLAVIRTHVDEGLAILSETSQIDEDILRMVATHHERYDGTGYPRQLHEEEIPLFGRIAGIVDSYDAMTTKRPYTDRVLSPHRAISEIYTWRDSLFEGELVEQFIQTVGIYPAGSFVELNSGAVGVVISINNHRRLCPSVMLVLDEDKKPLPQMQYLDLARGDADLRISKGLAPEAYGIQFDEIEIDALRTF